MSNVIMTATIEEFYHMVGLRSEKSAQNFFRDFIATPLKEYLDSYYSERTEDPINFAKKPKKEKVENKTGKDKYIKKLSNKNKIKNGKAANNKPKQVKTKQDKHVTKKVVKNNTAKPVKKSTNKSSNGIKTYRGKQFKSK